MIFIENILLTVYFYHTSSKQIKPPLGLSKERVVLVGERISSEEIHATRIKYNQIYSSLHNSSIMHRRNMIEL